MGPGRMARGPAGGIAHVGYAPMGTGAAFDFTDAHVVVTGGSSGIGLAVATAFHDAGAAVTITGTREKASDYDNDLSAFDYRQLRLPDPDGIDALIASLDRVDVLVNNAGQNLPGGRSEYAAGVFEEVVAVNLFAAFRLAQGCEGLLRESLIDGGGSVINVGSMSSFFGIEIVPGYG